MLQIIVPVRRAPSTSLRIGSAAALALLNEGLEVTEVVLQDDYHYGRLIRERWNAGGGFVLVEDDVVPWPGAVAQLHECERGWCAFTHARAGGWPVGLGCVRFSDALVARHTAGWGDYAWTEVELGIREMLAGEECHVHTPPCAHVKPMVTVLRSGAPHG